METYVQADYKSHSRSLSAVSDSSTDLSSHPSPDGVPYYPHAVTVPIYTTRTYGKSPTSTRHPSSRSSSISSILTTPESHIGADRRCRSRAASSKGPYPLTRSNSTDSFQSTDEDWSSNASDFASPAVPFSDWTFPTPDAATLAYHAAADTRRPSDASISFGVQSMGLSDQDHAREESLAGISAIIKNAPTSAAADKARSNFVHAWLTHSYTVYQDGNVSRQAFYSSYTKVCERFGVRGVNAASFGKAVRAAFPQVKTRRLGVRGNSKYHYCGIRPAIMSEATLLAELTEASNNEHIKQGTNSPPEHIPMVSNTPERIALPPAFPSAMELFAVDQRFEQDDWKLVWSGYTKFCASMLEVTETGQVDRFEAILHAYYAGPNWTAESRAVAEDPAMSNAMFKADSATYDACLAALLAKGLNAHDSTQFAVLRQLGEQLEQYFVDATSDFSQTYTNAKVELVARFGHLCARIVGICQISQALKGAGFQGEGKRDMMEAWDAIDFEMIRNHSALATNCHQEQLEHCFAEFAKLLGSDEPIAAPNMAAFLDAVLHNFVALDSRGERFLTPRSFLVRATFVISQVMRDLTLRSDKTFGSFQLLSLFCQDYLGLSVLRMVALPPSAVSASVEAVNQAPYLDVPDSQSQQSQFDSIQLHLLDDVSSQSNSSQSYGDQPYSAYDRSRPPPAVDFPLHLTHPGFNEPMTQYATFNDMSFPMAKSSSLLTPLAGSGGDLTAKAHSYSHPDWPSSLAPRTPLSPSFLLAPSGAQ